MNKRSILYLVLSDIHLGHTHNTTAEIIDALRKYLKENFTQFKKLDILFIAGDIFDKLLVTNSEEYVMAIGWLTELALFCRHNKIKLRILEGTPSHDWKQCKVMPEILAKDNIELDFKYVQALSIEKMEDLGISILYVPDEHKHKASDTIEDVRALLVDNDMSKVDIAIMHGNFEHQLPIKLDCAHKAEDYLNIVKYYISIGHIHTSSVYKRIIAQGSFDRICMGEEEPKGGMLIEIFHNGQMEFKFIENKHSKIFKTLNYLDMSLEDIISVIDKDLLNIKPDSHVRVIVNESENLSKIIKPIKERFSLLKIRVETPKKSKIEVAEHMDNHTEIKSFSITPDNIESLLFKEIEENHELTPTELKTAKEQFSLIAGLV